MRPLYMHAKSGGFLPFDLFPLFLEIMENPVVDMEKEEKKRLKKEMLEKKRLEKYFMGCCYSI